jgi:hypothetical protein
MDKGSKLDARILIPPSGGAAEHSSEVFITSQTTSYGTGDVADVGAGNGTDWFTLGYNNGFGTTHRFTLKDGTGLTSTNTYGDATIGTDKVIVDWKTWNRIDGTVLCWFTDRVGTSTDTWVNKLSAAQTAPAGEPATGWYMPGSDEQASILMWAGNGASGILLPYIEFYNNINIDYWTSETAVHKGTTIAIRLNNNEELTDVAKTGAANSLQRRYYTEAELGL